MNKKIKLEIAVGVILGIAIAIGVIFWLQNKDENQIMPINKTSEQNLSETHISADCKSLGDSWELFQSNEASLTFCYKKDWGNPIIDISEPRNDSPYVQTGTSHGISFSNGGFPVIEYSTLDYLAKGPDMHSQNWDKIAATMSNPKSSLGDATERIVVNGKQALKVRGLQQGEGFYSIDYFVPKVSIGGRIYNLNIRYLPDIEKETDMLVRSMDIKDMADANMDFGKIQINDEFFKDEAHIYQSYSCFPSDYIDKLDSQTFEVVNNCFVKDKNVVFFRPYCGQDCLYEKHSKADPATLKNLTNGFLKDRNFVFYSYIRDGSEKIIKEADPKTFVVLKNNFSKDKEHVFYEGARVVNADASTFEVIDDTTAKDKNGTFSCVSDVYGSKCEEMKN